jgi:hypothetical protein
MVRALRGVLLVAGILALTAGTAHAQAIGSIFGKVTDQSGGVLPGVTVTVSGPSLQQPLTQTTAASGAYQFPSVPIGTFTVSFELSGFKKAVRQGVVIDTGFRAQIDMKLELGTITQELTVTAAAPVVDTKKTTTGSTFSKEIFENIPTARDPWQIIGMTPGVQAGLNVGGSASGQQVGLSIFGTGANVQWNLEGGSITDLSSNSSPSYFNFDSFEQIQVVTGGGDVSVQSSGLSINLVTKSGSNVFKGTALTTFENDKTQWNNVSKELFYSSSSGFLSGNPIQRIGNYSVEYGGPIKRNRLWWWAAGDWQDINSGVLNFFDGTKGQFCQDLIAAQKLGALSGAITYDKLEEVQGCLQNDKTTIKDMSWKFNYQLNAANKFQYLFQSDNKYRNRRGASANTLVEAVTQQTSDKPVGIGYWGLPLPTHSLTHTLILTDRLVFNNQFTYVHGGFFLDYQDVPPQGDCAQSRYMPFEKDPNAHPQISTPNCLWNVQSLSNRTTGISSRALGGTYQTERHSWEAKTDGTYFLSNMLGGDHSLKFGVGWRRNPILTYTHYSGGSRVTLQCSGNLTANCGTGAPAPAGSATGLVPRSVGVGTDDLGTNNDWWTYNGYIQESYSRGKLRLNGGVRYDWQTSKVLAGCTPAAMIPIRHPVTGGLLLPAQCQDETNKDPVTGETLRPFSQWAPRVSATYDLLGNGKTQLHGSYSLYYSTKITLANQLSNLGAITLSWGNMNNNGTCSTTNNASCWQDLNLDGFVQMNELSWVQGSQITTPSGSGIPSGPGRFNIDTGLITPGRNSVDSSAQIGRTREGIVGVQHELIPNLAVGVDYVYRNYDRGTFGYPDGQQPGCESSTTHPCIQPGYPLGAIYTVKNFYTDPVTGITAPYYTATPGVVLTTGLSTITMTSQNYSVYKGVILQATKRYSDKWQMQTSVTLQTNPGYTVYVTNPTGLEYSNGRSTNARYLFKMNGAYSLPWGMMASGNLNVNDGGNRTLSINGPGTVPLGSVNPSGTAQTIGYNTLNFQPAGTTRLQPIKLLDLGLSKTFALRGGKNRLKVMLDGFNVFNINTVTNWGSGNLSTVAFTQPSSIVPPRVVRFGAQFSF